MDAEAVAALAALGGSLVGGGISAVANRRKTRADATKILSDAAASIVAKIDDDNDDLRTRVSRLERQREADRRVQQAHVSWDALARERLREKGIDLPEPPPLYAPEVA